MNHQVSALEPIEQVLNRKGRAAVSCSFQAGGVALLHMLRRYRPRVPVPFVDSGYHFDDTLRFRDEGNPRAGRWDGTKLECGLHTLARDVS